MDTARPAPQRTCVGCRRTGGRDELVRVVRTASGELETGTKLPGRGAWLCPGSVGCLDKALTRGGLARALRSDFAEGAGERLRERLYRR